MKNISRRVFIKGLAVAGVAAAASTVLAGCNTDMIPDVDNGTEDDTTEEVPAKDQAMTYTDKNGKKLTITATGCTVVKAQDLAVVGFKIDNKTATKFTTTSTKTGLYYVDSSKVSVYFDGDKANTVTDSFDDTDDLKNLFSTNGVDVDADKDATYFMYVNTPKTWSKVTIAFDVMKEDSTAGDYVVRPAEFTFENK